MEVTLHVFPNHATDWDEMSVSRFCRCTSRKKIIGIVDRFLSGSNKSPVVTEKKYVHDPAGNLRRQPITLAY